MEIAITLLLGIIICVGAWYIIVEVCRRFFPHAAILRYGARRARLRLDPAEEKRLWEDLVKRLRNDL